MTLVISVILLLVLLLASVVSSSSNSSTSIEVSSVTSLQHKRLTMIGTDTFSQIQSWEQTNLCMEVFKTWDKVGRLWLRQCKSKSDSGFERQMFGVKSDGRLHPSTRPSSCIFLYDKKNFIFRNSCAGVLDPKKNQFMYDFFDHTFFLMGDVAKVMTVSGMQEKKEVKLQPQSSSNITNQRWTIHFEGI
jgi:hypothetical protein